MSSSQLLMLLDGSTSTDATTYRQVVGSIQYLSLTRPNISYAINKLSQFMHLPTELHWTIAKRVLWYLKSIIRHGLFLKKDQKLHLSAFVEANWAGNHDDRTSTSTYIVYLGSNAISWCPRKQKNVARSSTEAEYWALGSCSTEILWLCNLLGELHISLAQCPTIFCDNIQVTYLSINPIFHSKMKHISIDYHFVCYHVTQGSFSVSYISTKNQLANALTKPLSLAQFRRLCTKISVSDGSTILQGHAKDKGLITINQGR